jgi:soluble lytic murein transglycosylase-like protein
LAATSPPSRISIIEPLICCLAASLTFPFLISAQAEPVTLTVDRLASSSQEAAAYASFVADAARRFRIPEQWIRAVIQVESNGDAHAISPRGALGLMQIMPGTWVELRARYDLGIDPFDPHDNILAGTAYLREMLDRFGSEGFLAAYNAGPRRYEDHLATGRSLPGETLAYTATLTSLIGGHPGNYREWGVRPTMLRQESVCVEQSSDVSDSEPSALAKDMGQHSKRSALKNSRALAPQASGLFVQRSNDGRSR